MLDLKYNYVILGSNDDLYIVSYDELRKYKDVYRVMDYLDTENSVLKQIFRLHSSARMNKHFILPFQSIWNNYIFRHNFDNDKPLCFLFFSRNQLCNMSAIRFLRKKYPGCKCVAFWQDLVKYCPTRDFKQLISGGLDLCLSFDFDDANKYNMHYHPLVYSPFHSIKPYSTQFNDVYFVGKAKDRLQTIIDAFEVLSNAGLKCDFNITGVKKSEEVYPDQINYCDSMPYLDNLGHIASAKCLLEVMQVGGKGFTLRYGEAIMYDKRIITNNQEIIHAPFYSEEKINVFSNAKEIDISFPRKEPCDVDYAYKEKLLPSRLLSFIDSKLE